MTTELAMAPLSELVPASEVLSWAAATVWEERFGRDEPWPPDACPTEEDLYEIVIEREARSARARRETNARLQRILELRRGDLTVFNFPPPGALPLDFPDGQDADTPTVHFIGSGAPKLDLSVMHEVWRASREGADKTTWPPHPLFPLVEVWLDLWFAARASNFRSVLPFPVKNRASLPRLHRTSASEAKAMLPIVLAPGSSPGNVPDVALDDGLPAWLAVLLDEAVAAERERTGRAASRLPLSVVLLIGALVHLHVKDRTGDMCPLRFSVGDAAGWLFGERWSHKARDWDRLVGAIEEVTRLGWIYIRGVGSVSMVFSSIVPQIRGVDDTIEFVLRVPASARHGARLDWPQFCAYGRKSARLARAYLVAVMSMDRSASGGLPITETIATPLTRSTGKRVVHHSGKKRTRVGRSQRRTEPNPAARFVRWWTVEGWTQALGLDPAERKYRQRAVADLTKLERDGTCCIQREGAQRNSRFRIFGPPVSRGRGATVEGTLVAPPITC